MIASWKWGRLSEGEFTVSCDFTHTQSWRDIHRSFHTLFCDCDVVYTTDINNTDDRHVMTAYCYSCLSSAFRFSPFMDISVHISLDQPTEMFLVNTEKWRKRFGLGFVLLGCSRTRTVQLLPHKQIVLQTVLLPSKCFSFSLPEVPAADVITISCIYAKLHSVYWFITALCKCVTGLQ